MTEPRKTKKNISSNHLQAPKITKNKKNSANSNSKIRLDGNSKNKNSATENDLIESLLNKGKRKPTNHLNSVQVKKVEGRNSLKNKLESVKHKQNRSKKDKIMYNFHHAINSTNSDQIIVKMLELNDNDIVNFYSNLEKMIGKELSQQIRDEMSKDIRSNQKISGSNTAICPFCLENKSNCVILLCGHMICHKCGKNINRCKYPCPKCKKSIKYIQYIAD
tara:strand:+ start:387 stop:1046 length:660 start_codon:yes stop_codon:yes gene_type:complete